MHSVGQSIIQSRISFKMSISQLVSLSVCLSISVHPISRAVSEDSPISLSHSVTKISHSVNKISHSVHQAPKSASQSFTQSICHSVCQYFGHSFTNLVEQLTRKSATKFVQLTGRNSQSIGRLESSLSMSVNQ